MKIMRNISSNFSKFPRLKKNIKFVIIHYTGMQSEIESIDRLKDKKCKVSCHYLINRKGHVIQMVKDKNVAWHAGRSKWKKYVNLNNVSLGIELVNRGHQYGYQNFSTKQINSLIKLCKNLKKKYSIRKENFLGHSDIAPLRKIDPGEKFPWEKLSSHKNRKWFENDFTTTKNFAIIKKKDQYFLKICTKLVIDILVKPTVKMTKIIKSFQRRCYPKS